MSGPGDDKTEEATPRALQQAREKGNIARSPELSGALSLLAGAMLLVVFGSAVMQQLQQLLRTGIDQMSMASHGPVGGARELRALAMRVVPIILPFFVVITAITGAQAVMQTGGIQIVSDALKVKFERVLPTEGFKRIFSMKSVIKVGFSLLRLVILLGIVLLTLYVMRERLLGLAGLGMMVGLRGLGELVLIISVLLAISLVLMGLVEYFAQRWQWRRTLRMSKQEVRDEHKSQEGDPKLKGQMKNLRRNLVMTSLSSTVRDAQVVVVNPTHYSICLAYQEKEHSAPVVTAKGVDEIAAEIRSLARDFGVSIVSQPALARTLHAEVPVGKPVPESLYQAVAHVFVLVQRMRARRAGRV